MEQKNIDNQEHKVVLDRLLVIYAQVDYLIMRAVAACIADAPDDESRHVRIQ